MGERKKKPSQVKCTAAFQLKLQQNNTLKSNGGGNRGGVELPVVLRSYRSGVDFNQNYAGLKVPVAGREVEGNLLLAA